MSTLSTSMGFLQSAMAGVFLALAFAIIEGQPLAALLCGVTAVANVVAAGFWFAGARRWRNQ